MSQGVEAGTIETKIPARLDRLPWSGFHWIVIVGLGTTWINTESYEQVFLALGLGAVMMILGGVAELLFGVKAERESLESIAKPLTVEDSPKVAAVPAAAG